MAKKKYPVPEDKKRKKDDDFMTLTMLVPRDWSDKISERARVRGMTKTSYIQMAVEKQFAIEDGRTKAESKESELLDINKKLDNLVTIYSSLVKKK